ncbi:MAG: hypothetical protein ACR2N3_00610 [Pyrinomonadaceae bacterium]
MLNEENLISTLEQSLRQFQTAEQRLQARLREVESEAENLKIEIEALQNSAGKTEEALQSLFSTMRGSNKSWKTHKKPSTEDENNYPKKSRYENEDDYQMPPDSRRYPPRQNNPPPPPNNYRNNPVSYLNGPRNVAPINQHFEPRSNRFADRTITQACTLLLREAGKPLHVNDLYGYLREDGFEFKGNNPTISIAVSLNRNRRFRKVAPGTFDLVMRDASQAVS